MKTILVIGTAGFIGSNLVKHLFHEMNAVSKREENQACLSSSEREQGRTKFKGGTIVGIDNMNDYYDVTLKEYRLLQLKVES